MSRRAAPLTALGATIAACTACPRLARYVGAFRADPDYWGRPVPGFGDPEARLIVLGLAPGAHGANRTGRPFTGDGAGIFLYRALHEVGVGSAPVSTAADDALRLRGVYITNVAKCAPPQNKPLPAEIARCRTHLDAEFAALAQARAVFALGRTAHEACVRRFAAAAGRKAKDFPFAHGATHDFGAGFPALVDSFHPSRYNVNVGTLTYPMFLAALRTALRAAASSP
jgi:uracil-DNA glycosylase family 4